MTRFDDYVREVEERAKADGPDAVARWDAFNAHFAIVRKRRDRREGTARVRMGDTGLDTVGGDAGGHGMA